MLNTGLLIGRGHAEGPNEQGYVVSSKKSGRLRL